MFWNACIFVVFLRLPQETSTLHGIKTLYDRVLYLVRFRVTDVGQASEPEGCSSRSLPYRNRSMGVCSPRRPNAIGLSVLELLARGQNVLKVRCIDMIDGTPILDIKPFILNDGDLPSRQGPAPLP